MFGQVMEFIQKIFIYKICLMLQLSLVAPVIIIIGKFQKYDFVQIIFIEIDRNVSEANVLSIQLVIDAIHYYQ